MPVDSGQSAERPISNWLVPIRQLIRQTRLLRQRLLLGKKLSLGNNVNFGRQVQLRSPQYVRIANNVNVGSWFIAETNLDIGSDVLISSRVSFVGNDHAFDDPAKTIFTQGRLEPCCVVLEGDNLIGFGAIIVGNVTVGKGCIVGAGSVVTRDLPSYMICAGVPAKPIRSRFKSDNGA